MENLKFISENAKNELVKIADELSELLNKEETLRQKSFERIEGEAEEQRKWRKKGIESERKSLWRKIERLHEKESQIKAEGVSLKEHNAIVKELQSFTVLNHSSNIGTRDVESKGISKVLGVEIKIKYTRFTSFMRNVKGCKSLAGQYSIDSIEVIEPTV